MIVFDLECLNGHRFEGWFEDKQDLDNQIRQGLLQCPVCDTTTVEQTPSPVAIKTSGAGSASHQKALMQASQEAFAELTHKVAEYVEKNYEDVGTSFTKEALKMHYGATEFRNIRGTTTKAEDKLLSREGVPVIKIPVRPKKTEGEDLN